MTFDEFVETYGKRYHDKVLGSNSRIGSMIAKGSNWLKSDPDCVENPTQCQVFKLKTVVVDAGVLKESPWLEMQRIEQALFNKTSYYQKGIRRINRKLFNRNYMYYTC